MVFVVRVTLTPFLVNFSGHLELNPPLPTATTVFRLIGRPLTRRLWRMALIFVTNASLTIEGRPCQRTVKNSTSSWLSKFFWYLIFQSLKVYLLKLNCGYFFDAHLLTSGLPYFHACSAISFFIFSGRTCRFFFCFFLFLKTVQFSCSWKYRGWGRALDGNVQWATIQFIICRFSEVFRYIHVWDLLLHYFRKFSKKKEKRRKI